MDSSWQSPHGESLDSRSLWARWASRLVGYFADKQRFADDPEQEHRARLAVACGLTTVVWGPFFAAAYWAAGFEWIAAGVLGAAFIIGTSLFGLRSGWSPMVLGNVFAVAIFAIHGVMVVETGGPISPALSWLAVVLVAGFALAGPGWGFVWVAVCGVELGLIALSVVTGVSWPQIPNTTTQAWLHLAAVLGLCGVVFTFAYVFEVQKDRGFRALQLATDRERGANAAKSRFLANVSHEIRTPMNAVLGMSELVLRSELPPKEQRRVETIHRSASALLNVLNDILDLSKLAAGRFEIEESTFDLREIVDQVMDLLGERARDKGLEVRWSVDKDVPLFVRSDPGRIRQIMLNLVGNAVKFTGKGHVEVRVSFNGRIEHRDWVRFRVSDTGPGIANSERDQLFLPFSQIDSSATRSHGGTGLGLAISKELAERLGGEVWFAHKKVGPGATFGFDLPLGIVSAERHLASGAKKDRELEEQLSSTPMSESDMRVLIAEDNPVNQVVIRAMLEELGHQVEVVEDGMAAFEAVAKERPALILMDCQMPRMDGYEATRRIRTMEKNEGTPAVPIVGITAHAMRGDRERCLRAGMDDYMAKPIRLGVLGSTIRKFAP